MGDGGLNYGFRLLRGLAVGVIVGTLVAVLDSPSKLSPVVLGGIVAVGVAMAIWMWHRLSRAGKP